MNVIIFGCGRTGSTLGFQLVKAGHTVTVIEQNPEVIKRLGQSAKFNVVIGSGIDEDVLLAAGVKEADAFFCTTRGDNSNLMAAQIVSRKFGVEKVCIRVADPYRADAYRRMGYFCITPSALSAGFMFDWLEHNPFQPVDTYNKLHSEQEF